MEDLIPDKDNNTDEEMVEEIEDEWKLASKMKKHFGKIS